MKLRSILSCVALMCAVHGAPADSFAQGNGEVWSAPGRLDIYPEAISGTTDVQPEIATDNAGNWVAVWASYEGLVSAHSSDMGASWSPQSIITGMEYENNSSFAFDFFYGDITYAGNNTWVATWLPSLYSTDAAVSMSTDLGQTWSTPQALIDTAGGHPYDPAPHGLDSDGNGTVMVWVKSALFRSINFGQTWTATYPLPTIGPGQKNLAYAGGERWLLTSRYLSESTSAVYTYVSNDNGLSWSEPVIHTLPRFLEIYDVDASGDEMGLLIRYGEQSLAEKLIVLASTDAGENWTTVPLTTNYDLYHSTISLKALGNGQWMFVADHDPIPFSNLYDGDLGVFVADGPAGPWIKHADVAVTPDINEKDPALASDAQGNVLLLYAAAPPHYVSVSESHFYDVFSVLQPAGSSSWTAPSQVSFDGILNAPINEADVSIAAGDEGVMIAVWLSAQNFAARQVMTARSTDSGMTWSTPVSLGTALREPRIVYAGQGRWMAWWQESSPVPVSRISNDNGLTWSANENFYGYAVAGSSHGTMVKLMALYSVDQPVKFELARFDRHSNTWSDFHPVPERLRSIVHSGGSNWFATDYFHSAVYASFDDGLTWTRLEATNLPRPGENVEFATDHAGTVLAIYPEPAVNGARQLVVSKSTNSGLSWTSPVPVVSVQNLVIESLGVPFMTVGFSPQPFPAVNAASAGNGRWVVSWQTNPASGPPAVFTAFSDDNGASWSVPELAATYGNDIVADAHGMAADAENVVVAWPFYEGSDQPNNLFREPFVELPYSYKAVPEAADPDPASDLTGDWGLTETECKTTKKGQKCKLKAQIVMANVGEVQAAEKPVVRFYLSDNPVLDPADVELKSKKLAKLKPGQSKSQKVTLKTDQPFTGKYLIAVLDADGQVTEANESNNTIVSQPLQ